MVSCSFPLKCGVSWINLANLKAKNHHVFLVGSWPQVTLQLLILSICPLAPEELLGSKVFLAPDTLW
jgi:hypothetical protein